jgi:hypothetical protein
MEVSGQLHALDALPPGKEPPGTHWIGGWVGHRAVLDAVVKRKIPSPCRESNPRTPIIQRYTDWANTALPPPPPPWRVSSTHYGGWLSGPQSRSGSGAEKRIPSRPLPSKPGRSARIPVTVCVRIRGQWAESAFVFWFVTLGVKSNWRK